jgi:hypothetical protein
VQIQSQGFSTFGTQTVVENFAIALEQVSFATKPPAGPVVASVEEKLFSGWKTPPVVGEVKASIEASMPKAATIAGAAEVRPAQGDPTQPSTALIIDFQGLRTVSEVVGTAVIHSVAPWLGTKFDVTNLQLTHSIDGEAVTFKEVQTERLLVTFKTPVAPSDLAANGAVVIPTPPSNLELLVNGTRAWFQAGAVPNPFSLNDIDITAAVAAAAASGSAVVTLRAAAPAALTLTLKPKPPKLLWRYVVAFPEGATRTVDAPSEGVYPLSLPVSTQAVASAQAPAPGTWLVKGIALDVSAKIPTVRVEPPDGPALSGDAVVVLDPNHALVARLPPSSTGSFASVTGVRLLVSAGTDGAELAGTLRANTKVNEKDTPGDPLPKGALGPATLAASTAPAWIDLALTTPHQLAADEVVWVELEVGRGSLVWTLAALSSTDADNAELRRRTSSGKFVSLTTLVGITDYVGALRVVGEQKANDPLAAVRVAPAGGTDVIAGVPTQAGTKMLLCISAGIAPSALADGDFEVPLELTIATPGSYAITSAELQYTQTSGG